MLSTWLLHYLQVLSAALLTLVCAAVVGSATLVGALRWIDPPTSAFMLRHAQNLRRLERQPPYFDYRWTQFTTMSSALKLAAIAGEDQRFPEHLGFDLIQLRRAWRDYRAGARLRGASTISQQTAKNLFLWHGSSVPRKIAEGWFTLLIELLWPKTRILEVYLNVVHFGPGTYGAEAASQHYFHRPAAALDLSRAALLIGALPAPGVYRIDQPSTTLRRRAEWIVDQSGRLGGTRYLRRL